MKNIVVIDDNEDIRWLIYNMLNLEGYNVYQAPESKTAFEIIRTTPIDLVITDLIMPDKDGLEIIMDLRRDFPDIKIIAISAGGQIGPSTYLDMAMKLGADRILYKPFNQSDVIKVVRELS